MPSCLLALLLVTAPCTNPAPVQQPVERIAFTSEIAPLDQLPVASVPAKRVDLARINAEQEAAEAAIPKGIGGNPFAPDGLSNCDEMNFYRVQWGLPSIFAGIGWRESNCRNEDSVHTSCCHGYWQMHRMHFKEGNAYDQRCGVDSYTDLNSDSPLEKQKQACAAKILYDAAGTSPWAATR